MTLNAKASLLIACLDDLIRSYGYATDLWMSMLFLLTLCPQIKAAMADTKEQLALHAGTATETLDFTPADIEMNVAGTRVIEQKQDDPFLITFDEPYDPDK